MDESASQARRAKGPPEVIEILDEDEGAVETTPDDFGPFDAEDAQFQEDLRRAMEASKAESEAKTATRSTSASVVATPEPSMPQSTTSFLLDRAAMERERLARQKRLRPDIASTPAGKEVDDNEDDEDEGDAPRSKRPRFSATDYTRASSTLSTTRTDIGTSASTSRAAAPEEHLFWDGEMRQTANAHVDRMKDTKPVFRLTEIIAPVCCGFGWCEVVLTICRSEMNLSSRSSPHM